jgi:hypothetical protein
MAAGGVAAAGAAGRTAGAVIGGNEGRAVPDARSDADAESGEGPGRGVGGVRRNG